MASSQQNPNVKVYGPPSLPLLALARFRLVELLLELTLPCSRPAFRVLRAPANRAFVQGPPVFFACLRARWEGVVLQQGGWVVTKPQTAPDLFSVFPPLAPRRLPRLARTGPHARCSTTSRSVWRAFQAFLAGCRWPADLSVLTLSHHACLPPPHSLDSWFAQTDQTVELRTNGKPLKAEWLTISLIKTETLPKEGPSSSLASPAGLSTNENLTNYPLPSLAFASVC